SVYRAGARIRRPSYRPRLEFLEDRLPPGETTGLAGLSLWGLGVSFLDHSSQRFAPIEMVSAESNTTDRFGETVSREQGSSFTAIFLPTSETETRTSPPSVIEVSAAVGKHPETHRGVGFAGRPEATGLLFGLDANLLDALLADDQDLFGQT